MVEIVIIAVLGVVVAASSVLWVAGWVSAAVTGGSWSVSPAEAVVGAARLVPSGFDPGVAYDQPEGPKWWGFWVCAIVLGVVAGIAAVKIVGAALGRRWGLEKRQRLGSSPEAAMAKAKDLAPLHAKLPLRDRFLIGRCGRQLLATENREATGHGRKRGALAHRLDRGAVMYVGPSRVGKTTAALTGILEWSNGPVVLCSVKDDLLEPTLAHRRRLGEVAVFDPTGDLCAAYAAGQGMGCWDERLVAGWSPLSRINNIDDAQRAARALCDAAPKAGVEGGDFWAAQAEILLSGLFWVAANHEGESLGSVVSWVLNGDHPTQTDPFPEPKRLLESLKRRGDLRVREDSIRAEEFLRSVWNKEPRVLSSVYATAASTVWPWTTNSLRNSASVDSVNLEWLLSGTNTLYLCAPPQDYHRLTPVYGGLINTLVEDCFRHVNTHGPINPPLLMVLDEAGNMPLKKLPTYAATVAGLGVQLVTLWQDLAQITMAYQNSANTVINNHLTKVFFPGQSGKDGLEYVAALAGEEEVSSVSQSHQMGSGPASKSMSTQRIRLLPANVVRMMRPGDAVMFHGTLPPAHISTIPHYSQTRLAQRQRWTTEDNPDSGVPASLRSEFNAGSSGSTGVPRVQGSDGQRVADTNRPRSDAKPSATRSGPTLSELVNGT